jgi:hypothetical protein
MALYRAERSILDGSQGREGSLERAILRPFEAHTRLRR